MGVQPLIPVTGQRKSVKIFGAVEIYSAKFTYQRSDVFNADTYLQYLEHLAREYYPKRTYLIHDSASYHTKPIVFEWFHNNRRWIQAQPLPKYSPELNATERLWHHVRLTATHNRYFPSQNELWWTLRTTFRSIQKRPNDIQGYLHPFL